MIKADGKLVCDSKAGYGEKPEFVSGHGGMTSSSSAAKGGHGHGEAGKPHISSMVLCWKGKDDLKQPQIRSGQMWSVEAQYNYKEFTGATHPNGQQENVMGIAVVWVKKR
jgi:hypothetical protein